MRPRARPAAVGPRCPAALIEKFSILARARPPAHPSGSHRLAAPAVQIALTLTHSPLHATRAHFERTHATPRACLSLSLSPAGHSPIPHRHPLSCHPSMSAWYQWLLDWLRR